LKDGVRKLIVAQYGLKLDGKIEVVQSNVERVKSLLTDSAFHFKVTTPSGGERETHPVLQTVKGHPYFCEHPIIRAIILNMWFSSGLESYGVKHAESFSPISLPTLALLMTMVSPMYHCYLSSVSHVKNEIEFCLNEWKTGTFASDKLQESSLKKKFSDHLRSVLAWDRLNPKATEKIRQKTFNDLRCVI
jgi:hypothetical protein